MSPSRCLVCGHEEFQPHLEILLRCANCRFVTARLDGPIDTAAIYDGDYFTGDEYLDYLADEPFFRKNSRKRLADVLRHKSSGRLLELGSAYGFFLDLAREHFDVIGFELNREAACYARDKLGLDVFPADFLEFDTARMFPPLDVTVMWDVIEHLERPDRFVERIEALSAPGATLHITTGDIGSRVARWRGRKWRLIHPPSHLHYFDRETLPRLLDRCGFETVEVRTVGVARSCRQIAWSVLGLGLKMPRLYNAARRLLPATAGITLNTRDIMHVIATKR